MTCDQMDGLADLADRYGSRSIRMTVWQNLLIPDIAENDMCPPSRRPSKPSGCTGMRRASGAGLIACTGNAGCKFAGSRHQKKRDGNRGLSGRTGDAGSTRSTST